MVLVQLCGRSFGLGTWSNVAEHMRVCTMRLAV